MLWYINVTVNPSKVVNQGKFYKVVANLTVKWGINTLNQN